MFNLSNDSPVRSGCRIRPLQFYRKAKFQTSVLDMTLNHLVNLGYPYIAITPRSTFIRSGIIF